MSAQPPAPVPLSALDHAEFFASLRRGVGAAARGYYARGWQPVEIPDVDGAPTKGPRRPGWQTTRGLTPGWDRPGRNVGLLTGAPSHGLADVDLDCPEAIDLAPDLLPRTPAQFGRASKPRSHWLYQVEGDVRRETWATQAGMLVELRGDGHQTMAPPSCHPCGERVRWDEEGEPATIEREALMRACARLASASLLLRLLGAAHRSAILTWVESPDLASLLALDLEARDTDNVAKWCGLASTAALPCTPRAPARPWSDAPNERERLESALAALDPGMGRADWVRIVLAVHADCGDSGRDLVERWSQGSDKFVKADFDATWKCAGEGGNAKGRVGLGTIFHLARDKGWKQPWEQKREERAAVRRAARRAGRPAPPGDPPQGSARGACPGGSAEAPSSAAPARAENEAAPAESPDAQAPLLVPLDFTHLPTRAHPRGVQGVIRELEEDEGDEAEERGLAAKAMRALVDCGRIGGQARLTALGPDGPACPYRCHGRWCSICERSLLEWYEDDAADGLYAAGKTVAVVIETDLPQAARRQARRIKERLPEDLVKCTWDLAPRVGGGARLLLTIEDVEHGSGRALELLSWLRSAAALERAPGLVRAEHLDCEAHARLLVELQAGWSRAAAAVAHDPSAWSKLHSTWRGLHRRGAYVPSGEGTCLPPIHRAEVEWPETLTSVLPTEAWAHCDAAGRVLATAPHPWSFSSARAWNAKRWPSLTQLERQQRIAGQVETVAHQVETVARE